MLLEGADESLI
jgi:hypothetical protein